MTGPPIAIPLDRADDKCIRAIQKRAEREGVSFDDAFLSYLMEGIEKEEKAQAQGPLARLFNFRKKTAG